MSDERDILPVMGDRSFRDALAAELTVAIAETDWRSHTQAEAVADWLVESSPLIELQAEVARLTGERDALRRRQAAIGAWLEEWAERNPALIGEFLPTLMELVLGGAAGAPVSGDPT